MPGVGVGAIDMQVALFETNKGATIKMLRSQVFGEHSFHGHGKHWQYLKSRYKAAKKAFYKLSRKEK